MLAATCGRPPLRAADADRQPRRADELLERAVGVERPAAPATMASSPGSTRCSTTRAARSSVRATLDEPARARRCASAVPARPGSRRGASSSSRSANGDVGDAPRAGPGRRRRGRRRMPATRGRGATDSDGGAAAVTHGRPCGRRCAVTAPHRALTAGSSTGAGHRGALTGSQRSPRLTAPGQRPSRRIGVSLSAVAAHPGGHGGSTVPTVDIEDPAGRRVIVAPRSRRRPRSATSPTPSASIPGAPLRLDGRPVGAPRARSARAGVRQRQPAGAGAVAGRAHPLTCPAPCVGADRDAVVTVVVEAGPGGRHGRHRSARPPRRRPLAGGRGAVADDALEPHHGLLDVAADGVVRFVQLTGRVTGRVGGEPIGEPRRPSPDGARARARRQPAAGRPRRRRRPPAARCSRPTPGDPWRRTLRRTPAPRAALGPGADPVPGAGRRVAAARRRRAGRRRHDAGRRRSSSPSSWARRCSSLFGAVGAAGVARHVGRRARSAPPATGGGPARQPATARSPRFAAAVARAARGPVAAPRRHDPERGRGRRRGHDAAGRRVGRAGPTTTTRSGSRSAGASSSGTSSSTAPAVDAGTSPAELAGVVAAAERFDDAAVPVDLGPGAALAVGGRRRAGGRPLARRPARDVGRSGRLAPRRRRRRPGVVGLVPVAAARRRPAAGPSVVGGRRRRAASPRRSARLHDGDARHVVVVTDRPDLLAQRTGPLRRFLGAAPSVAVVVVARPGRRRAGDVPQRARDRLDRARPAGGRTPSLAHRPEPVHAAGVDVGDGRPPSPGALAGLHDPEDPAAADRRPARRRSASARSAPSTASARSTTPSPSPPRGASAAPTRRPSPSLGATADGVVEIDLARDGPHALDRRHDRVRQERAAADARRLAGRPVAAPTTSRSCSSTTRAASTFDACADLPHTVGVVTDLDDRLAERALVSLEAELRRRERLLRAVGAADLAEYRAVPGRPPLPRLVVVIDEFAALAAELPAFLSALVGVAQRGRSLGIHLVLATQRPAGVVSDDIRANTNLRLALRLQDVADARDVVGDDGAGDVPAGHAGAGDAAPRAGRDASCSSRRTARVRSTVSAADGLHVSSTTATRSPPTGGAGTELAVLVGSIRHAAALCDVAPPHRPWLPPLPTPLDPESSTVRRRAGAVGLVDVPAEQRRRAAALAAGRRQPAPSLGGRRRRARRRRWRSVRRRRLRRRAPPTALHVYVIDGRGDDRLDALGDARRTAAASCGRTSGSAWRGCCAGSSPSSTGAGRRAAGPGARTSSSPSTACPALRAALDGPLDGGRRTSCCGASSPRAPRSASSCVMTGERPGAVPPALLAACAERWVFHLDDPAEAAVVRRAGGAWSPAPIPGRLVVALVAAGGASWPSCRVAAGRIAGGAGGPAADRRAADRRRARRRCRAGARDRRRRRRARRRRRLRDARRRPGWSSPTASTCSSPGRPAAVAARRSSAWSTSWREAHPGGLVHVVCPVRRSPLSARPDVVAARRRARRRRASPERPAVPARRRRRRAGRRPDRRARRARRRAPARPAGRRRRPTRRAARRCTATGRASSGAAAPAC